MFSTLHVSDRSGQFRLGQEAGGRNGLTQPCEDPINDWGFAFAAYGAQLGGLTIGGLCAARYKVSRRLKEAPKTEREDSIKALVDAIVKRDKLKK